MEDQLGRLMSIQISNITLLTSVKAGQMAAAVRQLLRNLILSLQGECLWSTFFLHRMVILDFQWRKCYPLLVVYLEISDAWLMSRLSQQPSDPAYYIEDCRISKGLSILSTLESGIDVRQGISVGPGKFVKKNKHRALNKRRA